MIRGWGMGGVKGRGSGLGEAGDGGDEAFHVEWFGEDAGEAVFSVIFEDEVVGEACAEEGFDVWEFAAEAGDAFAAAHAAADFEVEEDDVEGGAEVAGASVGGDGFGAIADGMDLESLEGEHFFDDDADADVVIHDEDAASRGRWGGGRFFWVGGGEGFGGWEEEADGGAGAW